MRHWSLGRWKDRSESLDLLQKEDRFKNSCFLCAVGIWSAAGRAVPVLQAVGGTHKP